MTFSIVARCRHSGQFGAAVCSSSPAVAARCIRAQAGIGAVASQNITDPSLGTRSLGLLAAGASAGEALEQLAGSAPHVEYRQLMAVDARGGSAVFTGRAGLGVLGEARGPDAACAGNLLADAGVPQAMLDAFVASADWAGAPALADRLLFAMRAGLDAGGEAGPVHSAGLLIVDRVAWPVADLRIDWSVGDPIAELAALWSLFAPQMHSYTQRALDPSGAPSYGVAGDP